MQDFAYSDSKLHPKPIIPKITQSRKPALWPSYSWCLPSWLSVKFFIVFVYYQNDLRKVRPGPRTAFHLTPLMTFKGPFKITHCCSLWLSSSFSYTKFNLLLNKYCLYVWRSNALLESREIFLCFLYCSSIIFPWGSPKRVCLNCYTSQNFLKLFFNNSSNNRTGSGKSNRTFLTFFVSFSLQVVYLMFSNNKENGN